MNLLNIINESFDKSNKNILFESKSKKLKENESDNSVSTVSDNNPINDFDKSDSYYNKLIRNLQLPFFDAAKDLGFQDFNIVHDNNNWIATLTYTDNSGNKQQAESDSDNVFYIKDKEDAIDCLMSLDWKVVDDEDNDLDENTQAKKLECKSQGLKEAAKKVYKYLVIDHFGPDTYYMIKSDKPAAEIGDWIFTDVSSEHGKGYVIWNDENIEFYPNKSPEELDKLIYDKLIGYMRDAEKRDNFADLIDIGYLDAEDFGLDDEIFYYVSSFDAEELVDDYKEDKSLSKYRHLISDRIENSEVDSDSGSAIDYVDIDDLDNYTDYHEFFEDED